MFYVLCVSPPSILFYVLWVSPPPPPLTLFETWEYVCYSIHLIFKLILEEQETCQGDTDDEVERDYVERVDDQKDRQYDRYMVNRQVEALYHNGVFKGTVRYYNKVLNEFKVDYSTPTSPEDCDYVSLDTMMTSIDVVLLPDYDGL